MFVILHLLNYAVFKDSQTTDLTGELHLSIVTMDSSYQTERGPRHEIKQSIYYVLIGLLPHIDWFGKLGITQLIEDYRGENR